MAMVDFRKQLMQLQSNMLNFAVTLTSDKEEAKDLLQDTTLKILNNEDKYVENVNFKGWAFTIMRNIFINNYRRIARDQTIRDRTDDLFYLNLPQSSGFVDTEDYYNCCEIKRVIIVSPINIGFRLVCIYRDISIVRLQRK